MEEKIQKIGIMGGTFDPIHIGHLILGETAYEQFGLDQVLFMPAGNPPHKQHREGRASDEQRVEMVRLAIAGNPHFTLSLEEMNAEGYSYTYRTLERLKAANPRTAYYFIIGADSLFDFQGWKEPERISRACTIVAATRNQVSPALINEKLLELNSMFDGKFLKLDSLNMDVSSKELRKWVKEGRTIRYYVPDPVAEYLYENRIYRKR